MTAPISASTLEKLAEAATPGPWKSDDSFEVICQVEHKHPDRPPFPTVCTTTEYYANGVYHLSDEQCGKNSEYIAAANPETIRALLKALHRFRHAIDYAEGHLNYSPIMTEKVLEEFTKARTEIAQYVDLRA